MSSEEQQTVTKEVTCLIEGHDHLFKDMADDAMRLALQKHPDAESIEHVRFHKYWANNDGDPSPMTRVVATLTFRGSIKVDLQVF